MEVRLTPAIEQIIPPQISFNFEGIRAELAQKLQVYQNMVVTEDGVKEAKADRARLNKFKAALADSRKSVKSQWNQPLSDFEDKMKELEQMVGEGDLLLTMGAGDVTTVGPEFIEYLTAKKDA